MSKASKPIVYAVHPSWTMEMSSMAKNPDLVKKARDFAVKAYMGAAFSESPMAYSDDDVYQISENEFYSYSDGLRYAIDDQGNRIAIIHLKGLLYVSTWHNEYESISSQIQAAESDAYAGVLIEADSPGGMTKGMRKLNTAIREYSKPIGVFVSGNLNSAAAYVTAGADFIFADASEDNSFGSIGVWCIHENLTKNLEKKGIEIKVTRNEGADLKYKPNPYEPWTQEEMAMVQEDVNRDASDFHNVMISQRGLSSAQLAVVKRGQEFTSKLAGENKLHDGISTYQEALNSVHSYQSQLFI